MTRFLAPACTTYCEFLYEKHQVTNLWVCADLKGRLAMGALAQKRPDRRRVVLVNHSLTSIESNSLCDMGIA